MKRIFTLFVALVICGSAMAFNRETVAIHSNAMNKNITITVLLPDGYHEKKDLPVVYLLHGHGDNHTAWDSKGQTGPLADLYNTIIVMPDGGVNSWYWDSPINESNKYETFVTKEIIEYIDSHYKTKADRTARAITGLSMGGHGALYLALRHQDLFGAAGSTSGGVDIRPFPKNWGMSNWLGTIEEHPENWEKYTVINMVDLLKPNSLKLIIDCGTEDFFYQVNCNLHQKLMDAGIPHDFYVRPGVHNWDYWRNSIKYQMLFFNDYFTKATQVAK